MDNRKLLSLWVSEAHGSQRSAAEQLGITQGHVSQVIRKKFPGLALATRIEAATIGWRLGPIRAAAWIEAEAA